MKAAVIKGAGKTPVYGDFEMPVAKAGDELISVRAAALSNLTKSRASGSHYSSDGVYPAVAGVDGVGVREDGRRVYFAMPEAPFGALAEFCPVNSRRCVEIPGSLDDITAAAIANPGMSAWAALVERAHLVAGETVLVNGATGTAPQSGFPCPMVPLLEAARKFGEYRSYSVGARKPVEALPRKVSMSIG